MRITEVHIDLSVLPKQDKEWKFALAANSAAEGWVVSIRADDGAVGYGYASTMAHIGAPHESVKVNLDRMKKHLIGRDPRQINAILADLGRAAVVHNQGLAGIDCALHDLRARQLGVPIFELFGGAAVREFATLRILPIKSPADMAKNARMLANKGVRHFKIKVHGDVKEDVARVAAIREELGPDMRLTIDANQSYNPKSAIQALNKMVAYDIDLVEQPVPAMDIAGLKLVTESVPIPIEADESAFSVDQIMSLVRDRVVDAISLKISKLGGLRNTYAAAKICEAGKIHYRMGAHSGPMLLAAHGLQLAAALPAIWYASELTEFDGLAEDQWEGLKLVNGVLHVSDAPGCGVVPKAGTALPRQAA
jgi:L-alanine-DL-glutamate epimerase-like enolase superfamily enzyme